nr:enolase C-terminal domain-like protein [Candidatus Poriferisodalis multihospitum]
MSDVTASSGSSDPGTVVERVETLSCDAAWRNYYFLKVTTADGVVGWAEYDEGFASPGLTTAIEALAPLVIGRSVFDHEPTYQYLFARTRQAASGIIGEAIGAVENALLDAKARTLGVPCYDLLGGKVRDRIRVYWSHCGTWRINLGHIYGNRITDLDGVRALGAEVAFKGFTALKTNIFRQTPDGLRGWLPGFGTPYAPELNVSRQLIDEIRATLQAFRDGAGDSMDLLLDLNFNARTEGYARIVRELADFGMFWIEIDSDHPDAMAHIRSKAGCTIDGRYGRRHGPQRRAAQLLRSPRHHDERPLGSGDTEHHRHGDRHRPDRVGRRDRDDRARLRGRSPGAGRRARLGHRARGRGSRCTSAAAQRPARPTSAGGR